jgi:hypothetical protein
MSNKKKAGRDGEFQEASDTGYRLPILLRLLQLWFNCRAPLRAAAHPK